MFAHSNHGRYSRGCANKVFNLGINAWQLHYLRLTNQFSEHLSTIKQVFSKMNYFLMTIMKSLTARGGLREFSRLKGGGSVWMTAWGLR